MSDEIYYADNSGRVTVTTDKDFLEPHKLRCRNCHNVFVTVLSINSIEQGRVRCPKCRGNAHEILDPTTDVKEENYVPYAKLYQDNQPIFLQKKMNIIKEDKNMKREQKNETQEPKLQIYRCGDTSRGIFKVKDLEPTDMFSLVCDEEQTVFMALAEEEPKYKTKKAVVKMVSGELSWIEDDTLIHVYRRNGIKLQVSEFEYPVNDYD